MLGEPIGIDLASFAHWAADALPNATAPFTATLITGGRSNITLLVHDAHGHPFVVRRPPLHSVLPTAHDVGREHRIISALGPTPVPVPHALAVCDDAEVIGAPFYVMSYVDGVVLHDTTTALDELDEVARARSGTSLVDALVALHAVDVDAVGLGDLARREDLVARQLKRWHTQYEASKSRDLPAVARLHSLLASRIPAQTEGTVVHGDFRLGNCVVDARGDVLAILDWEICTLGDPRADLGYVLATWDEPGDVLHADADNPTLAPGFVTRDDLAARYAAGSGRDLAALPYFVVFSLWRLACILEGVLSRDLAGARGEAVEGLDAVRRRSERCLTLAEIYAEGL